MLVCPRLKAYSRALAGIDCGSFMEPLTDREQAGSRIAGGTVSVNVLSQVAYFQTSCRKHEGITMKNWLLAMFCVTGMLTLVGCSNDHLIRTSDGQLIESDNKPEIDDDTGMIEYEDHSGRMNQIPQGDVREIKER